MCCSCRQLCTTSHVIFSLVYISIGTIQLVAGIFFYVSLPPLFRIGSNLWTGGWNVLFGVGGAVVACVGSLSPGKQQVLHYITLSILAVNVINLVVLEVGEFRLLLADTLRGENLSHEVRFLLSCARMSSSVSTGLAIVCSFIDAQITFCSIECRLRSARRKKPDHEPISDADYILPRAKTNSNLRPPPHSEAKLHPAHYTQSWVFDASQNPAESKTITLKRKRHSRAATDGAIKSPHKPLPVVRSPNTLHPTSPLPGSATPVVIVEDAGMADRQLHFMTSFSRTPSPVARSESGSESELSSLQDFKDIRAQPVHDHLEKLTEPTLYRKRLDSAKSSNSTNRTSPPRSVSPRLTTGEQPQYASLVMELEKTFARKRSVDTEPPLIAGLQHRKSDAEFSQELEAALKSIETLESPQSIDIKSPPFSAKSSSVISPKSSSVISPIGPGAVYVQLDPPSHLPVVKDHDSVEVKPWNAKVPEPRGKPPRSKSFVIKQDNGRTIINVKQTSSLESSPVPVHRSIVQIVEDHSAPSLPRPQLQSKNSFKCSTVNYSSLPLPTYPRSYKSRFEKKELGNEIVKKKRGNKTVGFRLENMPNNVRRAISFNESNSQESDLDQDNDSMITEFRNRSGSVSSNQGSLSSQRQNITRRASNVVDYGKRYKTVDSSYGTLQQNSHNSPLSDTMNASQLSIDNPQMNGTLKNDSYVMNHSKSNGVLKSNGFANGHAGVHHPQARKLNFSDTSNQTSDLPESSELSDVESKDCEMVQICFSEEESSANETSYVIQNSTNQNLDSPQNHNSSKVNSVMPYNAGTGSKSLYSYGEAGAKFNTVPYGETGKRNRCVEAGAVVECNNNLVHLPPTKQPVKLQSRWSIKSLLRRKPSHPISLPPELEAAFLKSESLIFLTEEELVARYESHKQTLRDIEQRTLQNMKASKKYSDSTADSDC